MRSSPVGRPHPRTTPGRRSAHLNPAVGSGWSTPEGFGDLIRARPGRGSGSDQVRDHRALDDCDDRRVKRPSATGVGMWSTSTCPPNPIYQQSPPSPERTGPKVATCANTSLAGQHQWRHRPQRHPSGRIRSAAHGAGHDEDRGSLPTRRSLERPPDRAASVDPPVHLTVDIQTEIGGPSDDEYGLLWWIMGSPSRLDTTLAGSAGNSPSCCRNREQ
jgi:hypothetical protein